jgi:hypothetical protein
VRRLRSARDKHRLFAHARAARADSRAARACSPPDAEWLELALAVVPVIASEARPSRCSCRATRRPPRRNPRFLSRV